MDSGLADAARQAFDIADYQQAITLYEALLSQEPDNVTALIGLGYALYHNGQSPRAIEVLTGAVDLEPDNAEASFLLGGLYYWQKNYWEAESYQRKAVILAPSVARYRLGLATDLWMLSEPELGLAQFEAAYQLDPDILGPRGKLKLWRVRIIAGLGPVAWLAGWVFLGFLLTIGGTYSLNRLLDWVGLYLPLARSQSGQIQLRAILMSLPFVVTGVYHLRKHHYRRVIWAAVLWAIWGILVWYVPHRAGLW